MCLPFQIKKKSHRKNHPCPSDLYCNEETYNQKCTAQTEHLDELFACKIHTIPKIFHTNLIKQIIGEKQMKHCKIIMVEYKYNWGIYHIPECFMKQYVNTLYNQWKNRNAI